MQEPSKKRRKLTSFSILDLPDDVIVSILLCLRPRRKFIGLRALRELTTIVNVARSCTRMRFLVSKAYGTEFESLSMTYPNVVFYQFVFNLREKWYPALTAVPFLCSNVLREIRLPNLSSSLLEQFLSGVVKHCPNLQHLTFHDDHNLSPTASAHLSQLKSLDELGIVEPSTLALAILSRSLPKLKNLFLFALRPDYLFLVSEILSNRPHRLGEVKDYRRLKFLLLVLSFNRTVLISDSLRRFCRTIVQGPSHQPHNLKLLGLCKTGRLGNLFTFAQEMEKHRHKIPPELRIEVSQQFLDARYREKYSYHSFVGRDLVEFVHIIFEEVHIFNDNDLAGENDNINFKETLESVQNARTIVVLNNSRILHRFIQHVQDIPSFQEQLAKVSINRFVWKITHFMNNETVKDISTFLMFLKGFTHFELCLETHDFISSSYIQTLTSCFLSNLNLESIQIFSKQTPSQLRSTANELLSLIPMLTEKLRSVHVQCLRSNSTVMCVAPDILDNIEQLEHHFPNLDLDSLNHLYQREISYVI